MGCSLDKRNKRPLARRRIPTEKVGILMFSSSSSLAPRFHRRGAALALLMAIATLAPGHASPRSNWAIDPSRTHISFSIDAIGYPRTQGEFRRFDGRLSVDFDHPAQSR